jgi:hypothetical protein
VNFRVDGAIAGSGVLTGGVAVFSTSALTHGAHAVVAEYAGDNNFAGATNALAQSQIINTPPLAGNVTIQRYPTTSAMIRLSTLLASASDADGDTLSIIVSSNSACGGTVTLASGQALYIPPAGFTTSDSFTYTVADGYGGSATGTVTVAIFVDNTPGHGLALTGMGNGSFQIHGYGIPGCSYRLQFTTTLNPANWQDIPGGSATANDLGEYQFTDTPAEGSRFYRTVYP